MSHDTTHASTPDVYYTGKPLLSMPAQQLYPVMKLRQDVFIGEQGFALPDLDDTDAHPGTHHIMAYVHPGSGPNYPWGEPDPGSPLRLIGTARVYGPAHDQHIGRVCVAPDMRSYGIGRQLMQEALDVCTDRAAGIDPNLEAARVHINAQKYAQDFYTKLGFEPVGEEFIFEGQPHVAMVKTV